MHGKKLSYNNIKDADEALRCIREFQDEPTVVAMKHMNPCGIGRGDTLEEAWDRAYEADSVSIFGGVIALNRKVDLATAEKMHKIFLEIIIAPGFADDALEILEKKKNIRLLELDFDKENEPTRPEVVSVMGGILRQDQDTLVENTDDWKVVTKAQPTEAQLKTMMFALKAVKHTKSNAIVVANDERTLGVGAGQPNRIDSAKIAIKHAGMPLMIAQSLRQTPSSHSMIVWNMRLNMALRRSFNLVAPFATKTQSRWQTSTAWQWYLQVIVTLDTNW
ncbi:hypothetical protein LAYK6_05510 [Lactobacillus amylovorus subsp. amylovorus]|nr:hypothetical protein LAYK6_05510 [Lactobacillus amylovorus]